MRTSTASSLPVPVLFHYGKDGIVLQVVAYLQAVGNPPVPDIIILVWYISVRLHFCFTRSFITVNNFTLFSVVIKCLMVVHISSVYC